MSRRKLVLTAGALIIVGGAAAIAAVGQREARMGHRGMMHEMGEFGHGAEPGRGFMRGRMGENGEPGQGGRESGAWRRSMSADDFDARTRERFARIDKNSDGTIDAAEVEAAMAAMGEGRGRFGDMMRQRFNARADANRDGKVTRQEALDRARRDFQHMDLDGDGRITDTDLPPMMRGRGVLKGETGGMAMRGAPGGTGGGPRGGMMGGRMGLGGLIAADANKDGVITLDEVLAAAGARFDLADRNKDGVIDNADHDAMRKETTDYRVRRFLHAHGATPDGTLTREQFFKSAKERFAELDANNDGRIDRQDWMGGRGMGPGRDRGTRPGTEPENAPERGPGMRDRGPPR